MNDPISWDPSLVKKFSSSNHYKLLNQLKNEVKKYPLNYKKKVSSTQVRDKSQDNKIKSDILHSQNISLSKNLNSNNEENSNKSSVSFNNSKNFSIYNNRNTSINNPSHSSDQLNSNEESSSLSFKDRLDQVDMK